MSVRCSCCSIPNEREALLEDNRCYVPAYLGAYGWIGVDLTDDTDWDEINELLDAATDVRPDRAGSLSSTPGRLERDVRPGGAGGKGRGPRRVQLR